MTRIFELRDSQKLTQKQLADAMGVSQVSVWQWENGKSLPSADKLPKLAGILHCKIEDLYDRKEA